MDTVTVTVSSTVHGSFTVDSDAFEQMFSHVVGDVNMNYGGYRAIAALISESTDIDYFCAGLPLLVACLVNFGHTRESVSNFLSADNDEWVAATYNRITRGA